MSTCPFCSLSPDRHLFTNTHGVVIRDGFPISPGHTLIIPCRHIASFFELEPAEREGLMVLLDQALLQLQGNLSRMVSILVSTMARQRGRRCRICTST